MDDRILYVRKRAVSNSAKFMPLFKSFVSFKEQHLERTLTSYVNIDSILSLFREEPKYLNFSGLYRKGKRTRGAFSVHLPRM